jgi:hypothetical protein
LRSISSIGKALPVCHIHTVFFGIPIKRANPAMFPSVTLSISRLKDWAISSFPGEELKDSVEEINSPITFKV